MSVWNISSVVFLRDCALFVLLCDAVARGFIQPLCGPDSGKAAQPGDRAKNRAGKGVERIGSVHGVPMDSAALQDARKALEVCVCICVPVCVCMCSI